MGADAAPTFEITVDDAVVLRALLTNLASEATPNRPADIDVLLQRRIAWLDELLRSRDRRR